MPRKPILFISYSHLDEPESPREGAAMIGATAEERAECRMWARRVDLNICEHIANGYRFGIALERFQTRITCVPEAWRA